MKLKDVKLMVEQMCGPRYHDVIAAARSLRELRLIVGAHSPEGFCMKPAASVRVFLTLVPEANPIGAIKAVREVTHLGLKEAKDLVDSVRSGRREQVGPVMTNDQAGIAASALGGAGCKVEIVDA